MEGIYQSMVEVAIAPSIAVVEPPTAAWLGDYAAGDATMARYLTAGERMAVVMNVAWMLCVGLFVLVAVAWALGVLPVAVRLTPTLST